ncbi:MAG: ACP S-malonyltransferase [Thermoanaerobaculia bacterium]|nr:ACP S-malonyltransferase [Thermoanaerobaculia bacterium]
MTTLVVREASASSSTFAALFPGQLSEKPGMGEALARRYEFASSLFEEISARSGVRLSDTFFGEGSPSLHDDLPAQVGVFAVSLAALETLRRIHRLEPGASLGYSLGTYAAFVAAGSLETWAALDVLLEAERLMSEASRRGELDGGMAYVVGLARPAVEATLAALTPDRTRLAVATENAAAQFIFSGEQALVAAAVDAFRPLALKTDLLKIKIPMHTTRLEPACRGLQSFLERGVSVSQPRSALFAPMLGRRVQSAEEAADVLSKQISLPSLFGPTLKVMRESGLRRFAEVGPGDVLTKLVRWTIRDAQAPPGALENPDSIEAFAKELAPPPLFPFEENPKRVPAAATASREARGFETK